MVSSNYSEEAVMIYAPYGLPLGWQGGEPQAVSNPALADRKKSAQNMLPPAFNEGTSQL